MFPADHFFAQKNALWIETLPKASLHCMITSLRRRINETIFNLEDEATAVPQTTVYLFDEMDGIKKKF